MRVIKEEGALPIKMWLDYLEDGVEEQARNLSKLPFAFHHIAIMADSHQGFGMPIGGVLATKDYVVPNAVGGDIGCGMNSVKTNIRAEDMKYPVVKTVIEILRKKVPTGANSHEQLTSDQKRQFEDIIYKINNGKFLENSIVEKESQLSMRQMGTLGGGNHFIEIQKGSDGFVYLMLHSGSRHLGQVVNNHYNNLAKKLNKKMFSSIPEQWDLAYLPAMPNMGVDITDGVRYIQEMNYAVDYALANRKIMMQEFQNSVQEVFPDVEFGKMINIAHNFASLEKHYGELVFIHRKGATQAYEGQLGIIPGSQGTSSYIVRGKGNPDSFQSCSHGAGRVLSRNKAKEKLKLSEQQKIMEGIVHDINSTKALDEAPGAYKNIEQVMANQTDLVDIVVQLKPLGVLKG